LGILRTKTTGSKVSNLEAARSSLVISDGLKEV